MITDTETGPGVFESALAYTDAARMADNACLFKLLAKSVGMQYGIIPTFMAKPYTDVSSLVNDEILHGLMFRCQGVQGELASPLLLTMI